MNTIIIYHENCNDGFGAALVAWLKFGNNAEYYPTDYTTITIPDVTNKKVFILDFSYSKNIILKMIKEAKELLIIDHHISAQKELSDIPNKNKIIDINHSGVILTWKYFFGKKKIPLLLSYIEDRDLWKYKLPFAHECHCGLWEIPKTFPDWYPYLDNFKINDLIKKGRILYKKEKILIENLAQNSYLVTEKLLNNKIYKIAYMNITYLKSEFGNYLISTKYPDADFAALYHHSIKKNKTIFSLRSIIIDVSEIAQLYGGGGHKDASGLEKQGKVNKISG